MPPGDRSRVSARLPGRVSAGPFVISLAVIPVALVLLCMLTLVPPSGASSTLSQAVYASTESARFDLAAWQAKALFSGALRRAQSALVLPALADDERRDLVRRYFSASARADELRGEYELAFVKVHDGSAEGASMPTRQHFLEAERERDELGPLAAEVIAGQLAATLEAEGVAMGPLTASAQLAFPPLKLGLTPPIMFRFSDLPLLLVVAPRDEITILQSGFLQPGLTAPEMDGIEREIDRQGVVSLVVPIGGFAAYPSMVSAGQSLANSVKGIAHEWVHHYLALYPLGQQYFSNYAIRSINETVADIAGDEVGTKLLDRHYNELAHSHASAAGSAGQRSAFSFTGFMAETRRVVEAKLDSGEIEAAEEYMADRKRLLEGKGYYLRKLNTAYLTFYGAYAGGGNGYEAKLRLLRERSLSLGDFLSRVAAIASERDFDALIRTVNGD